MPEAAEIVQRIRANGANVVVEADRLRVVNREKLTPDALAFVRSHARAIAEHLRDEDAEVEERVAIMVFDGRTPREWAEQFSDIIIRRRPPGISDLDWSWFVTLCARIVDAAPSPEGA